MGYWDYRMMEMEGDMENDGCYDEEPTCDNCGAMIAEYHATCKKCGHRNQ